MTAKNAACERCRQPRSSLRKCACSCAILCGHPYCNGTQTSGPLGIGGDAVTERECFEGVVEWTLNLPKNEHGPVTHHAISHGYDPLREPWMEYEVCALCADRLRETHDLRAIKTSGPLGSGEEGTNDMGGTVHSATTKTTSTESNPPVEATTEATAPAESDSEEA